MKEKASISSKNDDKESIVHQLISMVPTLNQGSVILSPLNTTKHTPLSNFERIEKTNEDLKKDLSTGRLNKASVSKDTL